jgi:FkbM family methyltransferase
MDRGDRAADHEFFDRFIRPGDTVVDVGANVGALTVQASSLVGSTGQVISIEAHPRTFRYLMGNLRLNRCSNVTALNVAAGAAPGTVTFSDLKQDDVNRVADGGVTVPVDTLDRQLSGIDVSLLKIDVEGYEKFVLEGATETLRATSCVFFEAWDPQFAQYGYGTVDVVRLLTAAGFEVMRHDGLVAGARPDGRAFARGWSPVPPDYTSSLCENLVAFRGAALRDRLAA